MKQHTIYISEDSRRFETPEDCREWETLLVLVRRVRERLWEARVKYLREEDHVGEQWLQNHLGQQCTDDCSLRFEGDDEALSQLTNVFGGRLEDVSIDEVKNYVEQIRREHAIIFDL